MRAEGLGKHKTISQMVTIIVILIGLAIREDWRCFGNDPQQFNILFSRVAFTLMLITVSLTLISGIIYFFKNGQIFFRDA